MKWLWVLGIVTFAVISRAADPHEITPYHATSIVTATFGSAENQLGPCSPEWGMHEASSFPPFTVGDDGTVYLVDGIRNRVMVFSPTGVYQRSIAMLKNPNLVDDLTEYDGALYWMGESVFGRRIYRLDIATGDTLAIQVANGPEMNLVAGERMSRGLKLQRNSRGLLLWKPVDGTRYPVVADSRILAPAEQLAETRRGGEPNSPALAFTMRDTVTTSGERTHGDIVLLDETGRPERILASNTSHPLSSSGQFFLHTQCIDSGHPEDPGRCYVIVTNLDGQTITRTLHPRTGLSREIAPRKEFELKADGSYYQLFLTENAQLECHIVHWTR